MKSYYYLFILLCFSIKINAQKTEVAAKGVITGKVVDANTKAAIEYATITVFPLGSAKPVNGIVTNAKGTFKVDALAPGLYTVTIDFIGYAEDKKDSLLISADKPALSLGNIALTNKSAVLQNVTVTTTQSLIENKIDKMIYNVDKDITSQGGVASDVLKKVPQVSVDIDGNVELLGSTSIRFLINGKPSTIFGNSIADALQSIPASQIQSIEVITSPGAKYSMQGTGGIINIILKKSNVRGMNGSVNLSAGTRMENGSVNLNYRHYKFGMNAYFSGNGQLRSTTMSSSNRTSTDTSRRTKTDFLQNGSSNFIRNGYGTGIGFDWGLTKRDNLSGSLSYHHFVNNDNGGTYQETILRDNFNNKISDTNTIRNAENNFNNNSIDWSLNYKKTFKNEKQELDVSYETSYGRNTSYYFQTQSYPGASSIFGGSNSNNPGRNTESEFTIDYTHPIGENFTLETGVKNERMNINSAADVFSFNRNSKNFLIDPNQSYAITYKRNVYAYYLQSKFCFGQSP